MSVEPGTGPTAADGLRPELPEDPEAYVEAVLRLVEQVSAGRVTTYGDLAEAVGRGGPRQVGHVLATWGGGVAWWRVVRADGSPARGHEAEALRRLSAEGTPLRGSRVVLAKARQGSGGPRPDPGSAAS